MGEPETTLHSLRTLDEFEAVAQRVFEPGVFAFVAAGAADEISLRWNREAFRRIALRPKGLDRPLRVELGVTIAGHRYAHPLLLAPVSRQRLVHPAGEAEAVRGAAMAGTLFVPGGLTTTSIEEVRAAAPRAPLWFQIYPKRDPEATLATVRRAEAQDCLALCLTMDAPVPGLRDRVERSGFALPPDLPLPHGEHDRATLWTDFDWLRGATRLPIVAKGILDAAEAARAVAAGADAIVVSNHGGRCLDTALASLDALPAVVAAVADRVPVLIDGGIRRGSDVLKALALGASAVMIGRPYVYALGLFGAEGVKRVVELLLAELIDAMALAGQRSASAIDRSIIVPAPR